MFPHTTADEVLYIIKIADTKINGTGNDVLHTFKKEMKPKNDFIKAMEIEVQGTLFFIIKGFGRPRRGLLIGPLRGLYQYRKAAKRPFYRAATRP